MTIYLMVLYASIVEQVWVV